MVQTNKNLIKVSNEDTITILEVCSKLTIKILEIILVSFVANFENISLSYSSCIITNFEHLLVSHDEV